MGEYGTHSSSESVATTIFFSPSTLKIEVKRLEEEEEEEEEELPLVDLVWAECPLPPLDAAAAAATSDDEDEEEEEEEYETDEEEEEIVDPVGVSEDPLPECDFII